MKLSRIIGALFVLLVAAGVVTFLIQHLFQKELRAEDKGGISLNTVGEFKGPKQNSLSRPLGVAVGENGDVYVADSSKHRVVVFSMEGKLLRVIGGPGTAPGRFDYPTAVVTFGPRVYVADSGNKRIQVFNSEGKFIRQLIPAEEKTGLKSATINEKPVKPLALAVDSQEDLYVADGLGQRILVYNSLGLLVKSFGGPGTGEGQFGFPNGIALDEKGNRIFISDFANGRIQVFSRDWKFLYQIQGEGLLTNPRGIAFDPERKLLFVADIFEHRIAVLQDNGNLVGYYGGIGSLFKDFHFPNGLYLYKQTLYVADRDNHRIVVVRVKR